MLEQMRNGKLLRGNSRQLEFWMAEMGLHVRVHSCVFQALGLSRLVPQQCVTSPGSLFNDFPPLFPVPWALDPPPASGLDAFSGLLQVVSS